MKLYICFYYLNEWEMDENKEREISEFYERLKIELDKSNTWPAQYLFKFIVPAIEGNSKKVETAFDSMGAVITTTKSKTGKFISVSVNVIMKDSQAIIYKYQELSIIEGIVSL